MPAKAKSEPVCTEVTCSSSVGGKVQIVKFEYSADFHYSMSRKYDVPKDWTERDIEDFQVEKEKELRGLVEVLADVEMQELMAQRDEVGG